MASLLNEAGSPWWRWAAYSAWQGVTVLLRVLLKVAVRISAKEAALEMAGLADSFRPIKRRIRRALDDGLSRPVKFSLVSAGLLAAFGPAILPGASARSSNAQLDGVAPQSASAAITNGAAPASASVNYLGQTDYPRIVKLDPPHGATGVSPSRGDISVTYDRAMAGGYSWVDKGKRPKIEHVEWVSDRECRAHVMLEPNRDYGMWLNFGGNTSKFRSKDGVSADRFYWEFSTGAKVPGHTTVSATSGTASSGASISSTTVEAKDLSLRGTVTGPGGELLAGVEVSNWYPMGSNPQKTRTDVAGTFLFERRLGYAVSAAKEGYAPAFEEFREKVRRKPADDGPIVLSIGLDRGCTVSGRVLDTSTGLALANVPVVVERAAKDPHVGNGPYSIWTSEPVKTGAEGGFAFSLVPAGNLKVTVRSAEHMPASSPDFDLAAGESKSVDVAIALKSAEVIQGEARNWPVRLRPVEGIVKDGTGSSITDAVVGTFNPHGSNEWTTRTDARGAFRFDGRAGYVVTARKAGYAPAFKEFRNEYFRSRGAKDEVFRVDLTMSSGGSLEGSVTAAETRQLLPGTKVWCERWGDDKDVGNNRCIIWKGDPVTADARGRFRLEHLPKGTLRIQASADGYARTTSEDFTVDEGATAQWSIALHRGTDLVVACLDKETSKPVADASVRVWHEDDMNGGATDSAGLLIWRNLKGGECLLWVEARGYHGFERHSVQVNGKEETNTVTLLLPPVKR